jgi:hypothetical protein
MVLVATSWLKRTCPDSSHSPFSSERAFSNLATTASAEAVSLEKSYVFGFGAHLEAFAEGEAQSMFLAAASSKKICEPFFS